MPLTLGWREIALRLALSFVAGALIGLNRTEHGRPAGLRTTILVSLAACVAMLQANLLLSLDGKRPDSFVVMDLMRLPLGILSGMGFIGGGAILRKGDLVLGVTTAATLWFITVTGLCFGGGQIGLGIVGTILGVFVLWVLQLVEKRLPQGRRATLAITTTAEVPTEEEIRTTLAAERCKVVSTARTYVEHASLLELCFEIRWHTLADNAKTPNFVDNLARHPSVLKLEWKPD